MVVMEKIRERIKRRYKTNDELMIIKIYYEIYQYCKRFNDADDLNGDVLLYLENQSILNL